MAFHSFEPSSWSAVTKSSAGIISITRLSGESGLSSSDGATGRLSSPDRVADFGLSFDDVNDAEEPASGPFSFDMVGTVAILVLDCSTICLKMELQLERSRIMWTYPNKEQ